jgi:hypothetical protein
MSVSDVPVTEQRSLSPRAAIALLTLQLRAAEKEAVAAEAEAASAGVDVDPSIQQLRDRLRPLLDERRATFDSELARARAEAAERIATARANVGGLVSGPQPVCEFDDRVTGLAVAGAAWSAPVAVDEGEPAPAQWDEPAEVSVASGWDEPLHADAAFAPPAAEELIPPAADTTDQRDPVDPVVAEYTIDPTAVEQRGQAAPWGEPAVDPSPVAGTSWDAPIANVSHEAAQFDHVHDDVVHVPEIVASDDEWATWRRPGDSAEPASASLVPVASQPQPTTVMIDTESFAKALALAIATVVEQMPERQAPRYIERPQRQAPSKKSSLTADAWHLDVMLLLVALFIVAAVLAAWMA